MPKHHRRPAKAGEVEHLVCLLEELFRSATYSRGPFGHSLVGARRGGDWRAEQLDEE
jgi:hypothetical protein